MNKPVPLLGGVSSKSGLNPHSKGTPPDQSQPGILLNPGLPLPAVPCLTRKPRPFPWPNPCSPGALRHPGTSRWADSSAPSPGASGTSRRLATPRPGLLAGSRGNQGVVSCYGKKESASFVGWLSLKGNHGEKRIGILISRSSSRGWLE